jgi:hypothetical protein
MITSELKSVTNDCISIYRPTRRVCVWGGGGLGCGGFFYLLVKPRI